MAEEGRQPGTCACATVVVVGGGGGAVVEVVEVDVHGEIFMHPHGDGFHQRQVFEDDAVALGELGGDLGRKPTPRHRSANGE